MYSVLILLIVTLFIVSLFLLFTGWISENPVCFLALRKQQQIKFNQHSLLVYLPLPLLLLPPFAFFFHFLITYYKPKPSLKILTRGAGFRVSPHRKFHCKLHLPEQQYLRTCSLTILTRLFFSAPLKMSDINGFKKPHG